MTTAERSSIRSTKVLLTNTWYRRLAAIVEVCRVMRHPTTRDSASSRPARQRARKHPLAPRLAGQCLRRGVRGGCLKHAGTRSRHLGARFRTKQAPCSSGEGASRVTGRRECSLLAQSPAASLSGRALRRRPGGPRWVAPPRIGEVSPCSAASPSLQRIAGMGTASSRTARPEGARPPPSARSGPAPTSPTCPRHRSEGRFRRRSRRPLRLVRISSDDRRLRPRPDRPSITCRT
jgi:hypothetical protein